MNKIDKIKVSVSFMLFLAYTLPFLFHKEYNEDVPYTFLDYLYSILSTLGIGIYLFIDSIKLTKISEYFQMVAGIWFIGLSFIFLLNSVCDLMFASYWYVFANILISFITWLILLVRRFGYRH